MSLLGWLTRFPGYNRDISIHISISCTGVRTNIQLEKQRMNSSVMYKDSWSAVGVSADNEWFSFPCRDGTKTSTLTLTFRLTSWFLAFRKQFFQGVGGCPGGAQSCAAPPVGIGFLLARISSHLHSFIQLGKPSLLLAGRLTLAGGSAERRGFLVSRSASGSSSGGRH